jgi:hypothetical protein
MALKNIFLVFLLALLLAMGWRMRHTATVQQWLHPKTSQPAQPIQFDNGSVRQERAASDTVAVAATPPRVPGTLRKCKKGSAVVYTDAACPAGTKEQALSGGSVTVLDSPKPPPQAAAGATGHGPTVRDWLGSPGEPTLREKHMERMLER